MFDFNLTATKIWQHVKVITLCSPVVERNVSFQLVTRFSLHEIIIPHYLQRNATLLQAVKHAASQHPLQNKIFDCNKYCTTMPNKLIPFEF